MESTEVQGVEQSATQPQAEQAAGDVSAVRRKIVEGYISTNKMDKTVVVTVTTRKRHASYGKYIKRTTRYMAHDERNDCQIGDRVQIVECRPLSKNKRWRVTNVIERAV